MIVAKKHILWRKCENRWRKKINSFSLCCLIIYGSYKFTHRFNKNKAQHHIQATSHHWSPFSPGPVHDRRGLRVRAGAMSARAFQSGETASAVGCTVYTLRSGLPRLRGPYSACRSVACGAYSSSGEMKAP